MERFVWSQLLLVGMGGFLGSVLRYLTGGAVQRLFPYSQFPFGTMAVNIIGCLFIGLLAGLAEHRQLLDVSMRLFLMVGLLGGFTTFSTFAHESLLLAHDAQYLKVMLNVTVQVVAGMSAAWLGLVMARGL